MQKCIYINLHNEKNTKQSEENMNNIEKYNEIMARYEKGEFGNNHLALKQILILANEENLLEQMSLKEIDYLIEHKNGLTKLMFLEIKKQKISKLKQNYSRTLKE